MGRVVGSLGLAVLALWLWMGVAVASSPWERAWNQAVVTGQEPIMESADAQSTAQIEDFRALPARKRGRIELSWQYTGRSFSGAFVVERSTNGSSWRSVAACNITFDENITDYGCTDANLRSGATYAYRACAVARGTACSAATATRTVAVKAP